MVASHTRLRFKILSCNLSNVHDIITLKRHPFLFIFDPLLSLPVNLRLIFICETCTYNAQYHLYSNIITPCQIQKSFVKYFHLLPLLAKFKSLSQVTTHLTGVIPFNRCIYQSIIPPWLFVIISNTHPCNYIPKDITLNFLHSSPS